MAGEKQRIKLRICNREYPLTIDPEKEEIYRAAERMLNERLARFEQLKVDGFGIQDCLAMTALDFAIHFLKIKQSREVGDDDVKALVEMNRRLEEYLNNPADL